MPALSAPLSRSWWRLLAAGVCSVLFCTLVQAGDILVVTDSQHPVHTYSDARLIELDQPARIKAELGAHLPADPARGAALVQQRLKDGGNALQARLGTAYQGVVDAWSLGVTTIPAVIVDHRYVVYGEPDVAKAVALIEAHQRAQP
ncbi:TIGR03757 family integrating conjugative element protein [Thauera aromatica]|uniref:TIGR03757 family integrating conjugative element protein n=1 Tax=Thauera aromatica TaxID=59405 RepID=UPI001FFD1AED|nr:TIGR03757 family integrating conjugative element protein [Thauera aromatica]MCK2094549.1 TIGR03757 family integrating conjugative element protein [Thauera aromatica]